MTTLTKKLSLPIFILAVLISFPCSGQERTWFPIGASSKTLSYGPLWVALRQGFFEQQGLDVQLITMRGDPEANLNFKGLETIIKIYGEINQLKGALPSPDKYVDQSYLKEVLKELGKR